jgi:hypothetical protein
MKKIVLIIIVLCTNSLFSQNITIRNQFIIKSHLLQEGALSIKDDTTMNTVYRFNLIDSISIKLTAQQVFVYNSNYDFYDFHLNDSTVSIKSKHRIVSSMFCDRFIIAIKKGTGESYRLKGFNGNDLLFLLSDISKNTSTKKRPKFKKILKELESLYIALDFICIYKSLMTGLNDECLQSCLGERIVISR